MIVETKGSVTEYNFRIRAQEADVQKRLKLSSLIMLMQEASMENALQLKVSVWDLSEQSWVLLRKEVQIIRAPLLGEHIRIKTYPAGFDRVLAYRDYIVYDSEGQIIATAASTWTLMNLSTRKIQRIPQNLDDIVFKGETLPLPESKLKLTQEVDQMYDYTVRMGDIDWNNHVNNIVLSKLMLQSAPVGHLQNLNISKFTFHIKSECLLGEEITITSASVDRTTHHQVKSKSDGRLIAMAICEWEEK